ncbi:MAG: hypothetical protein AABY11_03830, partial [archaeon]
VLRLIQTHGAPDLVEGRFERLLSAEELVAFASLREKGKVYVHRSNPKYEKGLYRIADGNAPPVSTPPLFAAVQDKSMDEYSLLSDGFQVLRTDGAAKLASFDLADRIKSGEVRGIKSFDGFYYIIDNTLLQKHMHALLACIKQNKKITLNELATQSSVPVILSRVILEFAKEEGTVIEKQKNLFAFVG